MTKTCIIEACGKPVQGLGLCNPHYQRKRRTGSALTPTRWYEPKGTHPATCGEVGCDEPYYSRFKCARHYREEYRARRESKDGLVDGMLLRPEQAVALGLPAL